MALKKTAAVELTAQEKPESELKSIWESLKLSKTAVIGMVIIILLILIALVTFITEKMGIQILPYNPNEADMSASFVAPCAEHWFGTDELGRDIFSRIMDGTKISLFVGFSVVIFSMFFGIILGAVAGYKGGVIDTVIMRFMDIMLSIPGILFAITLMAALGKGLDKAIIAIGIVSIPEYARIVRGSVLSAKESDYTQAARVIGNKDIRIIFKHILPNVISPIIVRATLGISGAILDTAALGFLGLGVQPPLAEWGDMLGRAKGYIFSAPYTLVFPGLAITLAVLAFNLFGDGLSDALDPKSRKR
ncbi:ABC transporter permease [Faecalicatena sp. AGMB00832]|uniref:ABC transporter permease n=1 Tax=Faecalicatena faecalis TaxID=2726362 RepID=A0ABS6D405_9FIRM|nr:MULTISPECIES: ABC transporter permease [Faecalicatena]MBU3876224.1 ABC transporter permease [Faecalicatena faecalis]MCI6464124.1 ABC transporter permease [Faecalicatena sp.]MDY5616974.1 ABC transporter permease [Lachnospiraceae bacterium]